MTITLWFKRDIKDEGREEDESTNEEVDRLNMKGSDEKDAWDFKRHYVKGVQ